MRPSSSIDLCDRLAPAAFATAYRRLRRLEAMAADPAYVARLEAGGRLLRLSAAIAWASDNLERQLNTLQERATLACPALLH